MIRKRLYRKLYTSYLRIKGARIGKNSGIDYRSEITKPKALQIGDNSVIYKNVTIYNSLEGKVSIGEGSHIAPFGYLLTKSHQIKIGNQVAIGPFCSFFSHSNDLQSTDKAFANSYLDADIIIGNNVFIGAQTVVTAGAIIHDNVAIGANSLVTGELESGFLYGGSPVRKIRKLD